MKTYTVIGVYTPDYDRFAESFEAASAYEAESQALAKAREEGSHLVVAGVVAGTVETVA